MGILNREQIIKRISCDKWEKRLIVTPLLSEGQISASSIDIRLGSSILIPRKSHVASQDVTVQKIINEAEQRFYEKIRLKYHERFILHPQQLILGATFEYLSLPYGIACQVMSRSSFGRLGLVVATAAMIHPGYKGCITLELCNLSESPIALYPGLPVGQYVFHTIERWRFKPGKGYIGKYTCPTEAEAPRFVSQAPFNDLEYWGKQKDNKK